MDDLLNEFLTETTENIATIDVELVKLEQNPNDRSILSNIFRLVHTIKGTCGFLGLPRLEKLAHAGEDVMGKFRDGVLEVTPEYVTLILKSIDRIKDILLYIENNETEPEGDDVDLIADLNKAAEGKSLSGKDNKVKSTASKKAKKIKKEEEIENQKIVSGPILDENGFPVAAELLAEVESALASGKKAASEYDIKKALEAERKAEAAAKVKNVPVIVEKEVIAEDAAAVSKESSVAAQTIRVNVALLENLMTLVSELVLIRNQLLQMVRGLDDSEFTAPLQRLSHITTDLQEGVMKTRMQPIGTAWAKLPRIVRDLCVETGKKIDLQMYGAETELDRQVLELIKDPLTHMVRNSADHGIEEPEERIAYAKHETGIIKLNAYHEGGHIIIEIADDGRGLSLEKIKQKILKNNLASESEVENMSEQQAYQYIFRPGFSTAEKVTAVSGRGVGMDVVKTNIEKIGGNIELKSKEGKGTRFIIKIPLTLAIVSGLIVAAGGERFAIPQISVLELVRVTKTSELKIEKINNALVLRLRDHLLPLVNLSSLLKLQDEKEGGKLDETFIVVSQVGTYSFGIIVDKVFDTEEIVVKPVAPVLRHITMFSGNTILGDGSVIMILDPNGIASAAGENSDNHSKENEEEKIKVSDANDNIVSLLVFKSTPQDLKAVPLGLVSRLEEFEISEIEHNYGMPVVQYRGQLMPIIKSSADMEFKANGRQPVLVFAENNKTMGLAVEEIVDIVEDKLNIELTADKEGLIGTAIIKNKAMDVIDTGYYLVKAFGDWFKNSSSDNYDSSTLSRNILIVDDSAFFRNLLSPLLSVAKFKVVAVESALDALNLREQGYTFEAIISDIEMPEMTGFDFAKEVRAEKSIWKNIPLIALSAKSTAHDKELGKDAGFDEYVIKSDHENIIKSLNKILEVKKKKEVNKA